MYKFMIASLLVGTSIGQNPQALWEVGAPEKEARKLTPAMLVEISDQLIHDNIAVVDMDPESFDLTDDKPKAYKKDGLEEIEFR